MSEIYVRRIPLDEVPDDDEGSSAYLHELYRSKVNVHIQYFLLVEVGIKINPILNTVELHIRWTNFT